MSFWKEMAAITDNSGDGAAAARLVLAVDTCGPMGSVALGRVADGLVEIVGETELEGRSYSATLVAGVGELLARAGVRVGELGAIVAVNGPGSFTGVRVGLSAVKGLAESAGIPVIAISRLEVLARKAGVEAAALDAHRHEVFLRVTGRDGRAIELLAGAAELRMMAAPGQIAVSDEAAGDLIGSAWTEVKLLRVAAPAAADAMRLAATGIAEGRFVDLALLDGHYLRRSDAEIFGTAVKAQKA